MFDFRLKVFYTVAKRLNFTKAAAELFITQPAVTKHIRELEDLYKVTLFERSGNKRIRITAAGGVLLQYAEKLMATYNELEFDMNQLMQRYSGTLRIGGSNTVAQYVIPGVLAQFHNKFKEIEVHLLSGNTEQIEQSLLAGEIDAGIVEGRHRDPEIRYQEYMRDELVLVCRSTNRMVKGELAGPEALKCLPLLMREPGSGTLEVIVHSLKPFNIGLPDLRVEMQLGGTESIKSYLMGSDSFAFLSVQSILKELRYQELRIIDIKGLTMERPFYFIQRHGQLSSLAELFQRFITAHNH